MSVSDSDDSVSVHSMLHVKASELYPKKKLAETPDNANLDIPFNPICGESVEHMARITDGVLALSNYRIYFQRKGKEGKGDFNIPLGLVEFVEPKELFHLNIYCKDAKTYRCSFPSNDACTDWMRKINKNSNNARVIDEIFAFAYFVWSFEEGGEPVRNCLRKESSNGPDFFMSEFDRMRFKSDTNNWRISHVNSDYSMCNSYPRTLIFPASLSDQDLKACSKFRSSQRLPTVVWRHQENGMIIARSSQPEVGFFYWRSNEDEALVRLLAECCVDGNQPVPRLLVLDARSYASAVANRARGGGSECIEYYPNIDLRFMSLVNIHYVRKSFNALRQLCAQSADVNNWYSSLENTRWLHYLSGLIEASARIVTAIEEEARPVLVHCSDGWDRTTQMVSLAELLLDPYYRTIEGFQVLCEREWLDFGHKFADRCGAVDNPNERCPVFLQWLDCVQNIMYQFPSAFEFSKRYLIKLAEHVYSNLFGTFLCNSSEERRKATVSQRTYSVWRYLDAPHFRNYLYDKNYPSRVLWPKFAPRDLKLWTDLYIDGEFDNHTPGVHSDRLAADENATPVVDSVEQNGLTPEADGASLNNLGNNLGSMLESAINCQPECGRDSDVGTFEENENEAVASTVAPEEEKDRLTEELECAALANSLNELIVAQSLRCSSLNVSSNDTTSHNLIDFDSSIGEDVESVFSEEDTREAVTSTVTKMVNAIVDRDAADVRVAEPQNSRREDITNCVDETKAEDCISRTRYEDEEEEEEEEKEEEDNDGRCNNRAACPREDCDIPPRKSGTEVAAIDEDCNNLLVDAAEDDEDTQLDNRLNGADVSVQTSVETVIDRFSEPAANSSFDLFDYKTVLNGLTNYEVPSCTNGRKQVPSLFLDPVDGLPLIPDEIQDRLQQISIDYKAQLAAVSNELHKTRFSLMTQVCYQCAHQNGNAVEKPMTIEDDKGSVCSTQNSWEDIATDDVGNPVLWVPDHAVTHCTKCEKLFWIGRRKHHCRACGRIFCADCSRNLTSLPEEQLFDVRVCGECYHANRIPSSCLPCTSSPRQITCKQAAAGEEQHRTTTTIMLPKASPF